MCILRKRQTSYRRTPEGYVLFDFFILLVYTPYNRVYGYVHMYIESVRARGLREHAVTSIPTSAEHVSTVALCHDSILSELNLYCVNELDNTLLELAAYCD